MIALRHLWSPRFHERLLADGYSYIKSQPGAYNSSPVGNFSSLEGWLVNGDPPPVLPAQACLHLSRDGVNWVTRDMVTASLVSGDRVYFKLTAPSAFGGTTRVIFGGNTRYPVDIYWRIPEYIPKSISRRIYKRIL